LEDEAGKRVFSTALSKNFCTCKTIEKQCENPVAEVESRALKKSMAV